jgi:hypothetical protein
VEGLIKSELYQYAWDVIQNFMDLIEVSSSRAFVLAMEANECSGIWLHTEWRQEILLESIATAHVHTSKHSHIS